MEMEVQAPAAMELSAEEIKRNQNAQHFKCKSFKQESVVILQIPNIREDWNAYFADKKSTSFPFSVKVGNSIVKFTAELSYPFLEDNGPDEMFYFTFKRSKVPSTVKSVIGKYRLEVLHKNKAPFEILETEERDWLQTEYSHPYEEEELTTRPCGLTRDELLENDHLEEGDTLTLRLIFTQCTSKVLEYPNEYRYEKVATDMLNNIWTMDMEDLLNNSRGADVVIQTNDGVSFNTHKIILQSRVPKFRAMFDNDMQEKASGFVKIPDISGAAMKILLHYIYTGKIPQNLKQYKTLIGEILNGANQLELNGLIKYYDQMLISMCNDIDSRDLLELAKLHGLKQAEKDIVQWQRGIVID